LTTIIPLYVALKYYITNVKKDNLIAEPKIIEVPYRYILRNQLGDDAMESCCAFSGKQIKDKINSETYNYMATIKIPDNVKCQSNNDNSIIFSNHFMLKHMEPFKEHKCDGYLEDDHVMTGGAVRHLMRLEEIKGHTVKHIINTKKCYVVNINIHDDAQCYLDTKSEKIYCDKCTLDYIEPIKKRHCLLSNDKCQHIHIA
tara:strand:- start:569 stop:1168 length:600 start_codon:yes stop_codon:yes gene_type:complete